MRRALVAALVAAVAGAAASGSASAAACTKVPRAKVSKRAACTFAKGWRQRIVTVAGPAVGGSGGGTEQPTPAPPATTPEEPPATPPATTLPRRLQVDEGEWYVRPSRRRVAAGNVELNITNFGEDAHDLAVERGGVRYGHAELTPGETTRIYVDVPAGAYKLFCTLQEGEHEAAGMKATLTVE